MHWRCFDSVRCCLQEPTDSLEETLLLSQPDVSFMAENGSEEGENPSVAHTDNPINHSPDNARVYQSCTCFNNNCTYMCYPKIIKILFNS